MIEITVSEIAHIIDGEIFPETGFSDDKITHIVTDSRTFFNASESIFFALTGPRNNGHYYIPELMKKGMKTFVVSDEKVIQREATFIWVKNTTSALQKLAEYIRAKYDYPVVGITGSNGKTIVKEWLHDILSATFKIVRSPKSYNSQVGVPLSVLLMNKNFNLAIFEAGISKPGEMGNLAGIIQPEIGIFTNIGDAHQENFTSIEQKIKEKLQLFQQTKKLIYSADSKELATESVKFCLKNNIEKISWSLNNYPALIQFSANKMDDFTELKAHIKGSNYSFLIPFTNDSAIEDACHCFAASFVLLKNPESVLPQFEKLAPVAMRLEIKQGINQCLLINDYYNSDLNSLSIALSVLYQQAAKSHLSKMVILSDIQQTGIPQNELYRQVNDLLREWKIDELIGIGEEISAHANLFSGNNRIFHSVSEFENAFSRNQFKSSVILMKGARKFTFEKISGLLQQKSHQTVLEIHLNALVNNLNIFRSLLKPETKIMVMVKAFSYGSGDVEVAKLLQFQNIDYLAVAVADEGVQLRNAGILTPIIVMNPEAHSFQNMIDYQLDANIYSIELLNEFLKTVSQNAVSNYPIHLKIDTGMNRLGFKTQEEIIKAVQIIKVNNHVKICSVFSHLAASDESGFDEFTHQQFDNFERQYSLIANAFPYKIDRHILNSAGIERFPEKQFEMVRLGIGLYGISVTGLPLENIGILKSTISQVKNVLQDETVGYGRKGKFQKGGRVAVVPLGYADGLDRKLSNKNGFAYVKSHHVPIIGNICMDMLMIDVTDVNVQPGDEAEFFGPHIPVSEVAERVGTIPYEILTGISQRVKRVYIHE
ncbi:MAG TPA: bifunctional UDP-N-acetylmuramoyl-tripeptide:D-alanyl-D-alanine ligase/alanine racemase [Draconibacterium sp.]|nr:bifunctional UDP-N-acetylmuramoyl-tripeptide:D-alanyl-D-alanine ligase/alanine racemase [Draconibacterium sp.]